ncbi:MAG: TMEM175 family protein [Acidobacteriota bacterium]
MTDSTSPALRPPALGGRGGDWRRPASSTRLEALSDGVFAFSATLLVVSLEVPRTFEQLVGNLGGFVGFGFSFAILMMIWTGHHGFFRRFPLQDTPTIALNSLLLFLVLFYVYPLKFLTSVVAGLYLGTEDVGGMIGSRAEMGQLMLLYSGGFVAVYACFIVLYSRVAGRRRALGLSALELFEARAMVRHYGIYVGVGALSIALTLGDVGTGYGGPGWVYVLLGPLCGFNGVRTERRRRELAAEAQ